MNSPQMAPQRKTSSVEAWFWPVIAALAGVAVEIGIAVASGRRESWDSGAYWLFGLPVMVLAAFGCGWMDREHPVRVGYAPFAGQFATMLLRTGMGSLFVLGLIFIAVLGLAGVAAAMLGSRLARR